MYFYDIGYGSYEDSSYTQYCHETAYSKEEFDRIVEDCLIEALHVPFPHQDGWPWHWPPNFSDVLGTKGFHAAIQKRGFKPLQFHQQWGSMGWGVVDDPTDWSESNKETVTRILSRVPKHPRANIRPLPSHVGFGFTAKEPIPADLAALGYRYEQKGIYHNYFFTPQAPYWPVQYPHDTYALRKRKESSNVMDGFSPNLNKKLHAGHLKGLAFAAAIHNINGFYPAAMLGASQGIVEGAREELDKWYELARYKPYRVYLDTELPPPNVPLVDGEGEYAGCKMWIGPNGPVVIYKSDGKPTYAAHDLSFSQDKEYSPEVYLTGAEQKDHFKSLGFGDKHHSIGLLLGSDGAKMRSRDGDVVTAKELYESIQSKLRPIEPPPAKCACYHLESQHLHGKCTVESSDAGNCDCAEFKLHEDWVLSPVQKLAWNILAWQFCSAEKSQDTRFDLEQWSNPASPGMQISYTYARFASVLWNPERMKAEAEKARAMRDRGEEPPELPKEPPEEVLHILAMSQYHEYWLARSRETMEPCYIARYAHELAMFMNDVYGKVRLSTAEGWTLKTLNTILSTLKQCMESLGMYTLERV